MHRVAGRPVVMPLQPAADVIRDTDVVARCIRIALKDLHDPLLDAVHTGVDAQIGPDEISNDVGVWEWGRTQYLQLVTRVRP